LGQVEPVLEVGPVGPSEQEPQAVARVRGIGRAEQEEASWPQHASDFLEHGPRGVVAVLEAVDAGDHVEALVREGPAPAEHRDREHADARAAMYAELLDREAL